MDRKYITELIAFRELDHVPNYNFSSLTFSTGDRTPDNYLGKEDH